MEEVLYDTIQLAAKKKNKKKKKTEKVEEVDEVVVETTTEEVVQEEQNPLVQLDWNNPSWDLFLVLFFLVGALLYGLSLGKDRIIAIMVSIYMAVAIIQVIPQDIVDYALANNITLEMTAFVALFAILFFALSRSALLNAMSMKAQGSWWQVVALSFLHVGLLVSVVMSFLPPEILGHFSQQTQDVFLTEWARFGWMVAPVAAMLLLGGKDED